MKRFSKLLLFSFLFSLMVQVCDNHTAKAEDVNSKGLPDSMTVIVMDPLSAPLACDCVQGYAQRKYEELGTYLQSKLGIKEVKVVWAESLEKALEGEAAGKAHLVIGKDSVVRADAIRVKRVLTGIASLTDSKGSIYQQGWFVVDAKDPAATILDLEGYRVLFGPSEADEKHGAAKDYLQELGIEVTPSAEACESCSVAAKELLAIGPEHKTAAVISSYAAPLLEGCGSIKKGDLRIVGQTGDVRFISAFVDDALSTEAKELIVTAILSLSEKELLSALETKSGFIPYESVKKNQTDAEGPAIEKTGMDWPGWRGRNGDAHVETLPAQLDTPKRNWQFFLPSQGIGGVAATEDFVVVSSRDANEQNDLFFSLDPTTGVELWRFEYSAPGRLDYGSSPRATPLIHDPYVFTLGAFGDLHCLDIDTGEVIWKRHLVNDLGGVLPNWGFCASPLVSDDKLIIMHGGSTASLAALNLTTGETLWTGSGSKVGYATPLLCSKNGRSQVVGYEERAFSAWDLRDGVKLWSLVPEWEGDFNVPSPICLGNQLVLVTENNGTRSYHFDEQHRLIDSPVAKHDELTPDTHSPLAISDLILGVQGGLIALDASDSLRPLWNWQDHALRGHCSLIAGGNRLLIITERTEVILLDISRQSAQELGRFQADPTATSMLAHPAIVGSRLFLRGKQSLEAWDLAG